ncbi:SIR2 family protein [Cellvibrio mixtus]|uniref:SIR2 family protein n=1 Tax=Cellvibrio mixtus TaxID=39650 RepID=UPI000A456800|nr:SIR2 family protein [Cellvibrio mixtus]
MSQNTVHNPDRYMADLRQILSQGKKRIGILLGAGAPVSLRVDGEGKLSDTGSSIIPDVAGLTKYVFENILDEDRKIVDLLLPELDPNPNIETILTRIRRLSQAIGTIKIHGLDGSGYEALAERICEKIGERVAPSLPQEVNPYTELVSWVSGITRDHPVEIFSPNYDLLLEEAFERAHLPYFDGFSGAHKPFFDPTSVATDRLPSRWSRLWKIHGSLGWDISGGTVIRTGSRSATKLIYPDHLKYDQISRQPFSSLFERLKSFLTTPDSLLICTGFSFFDSHIAAVLDEALEANKHTAVLAFQYKNLSDEMYAVGLALKRPNMSVYARDGAVIFGVKGNWVPGQSPSNEWLNIRRTFWGGTGENTSNQFLLGDFSKLARFFALSQSSEFIFQKNADDAITEGEDSPSSVDEEDSMSAGENNDSKS